MSKRKRESPPVDLATHIVNLYRSGELSDISIVAYDTVFSLHKCIVIANPFFRELLRSDSQENDHEISGRGKIELEDCGGVSVEAFRVVIERLYGIWDEATITETNVKSLLGTQKPKVAGTHFGDLTLCSLCLNSIKQSITSSTIGYYMRRADDCLYGIHSFAVLESCRQVACLHGPSDLEFFSTIPPKLAPQILASNCLAVFGEHERAILIAKVAKLLNMDCAVLLKASVVFSSCSESELAQFEKNFKWNDGEVLKKALWDKTMLRLEVSKAKPDGPSILGLKSPAKREIESTTRALFDWNSPPDYWNRRPFPPFRFACYFGQGLHSVYRSKTRFYGGSHWSVRVTKKDGAYSAALVREESDPTASEYCDSRILVKIWFEVMVVVGDAKDNQIAVGRDAKEFSRSQANDVCELVSEIANGDLRVVVALGLI
ncbi:hypothetical protein HDU82_008287 [Entophlyctis luteolus]|nr:hypothetical protein HDU82_008287 [Entophlyctis luteolus]